MLDHADGKADHLETREERTAARPVVLPGDALLVAYALSPEPLADRLHGARDVRGACPLTADEARSLLHAARQAAQGGHRVVSADAARWTAEHLAAALARLPERGTVTVYRHDGARDGPEPGLPAPCDTR